MVEKIRPDEIDAIICAEIPDPETDSELYEVVTTNMIHGPCGDHNRESPCMIENKCSKRNPRALLADTITDNNGYPLYRRRSAKDNGRTITLKVKNKELLSTIAGLVLIRRCFSKHSKRITMLSTATLLSPSKTFASMSRHGCIWYCSS